MAVANDARGRQQSSHSVWCWGPKPPSCTPLLETLLLTSSICTRATIQNVDAIQPLPDALGVLGGQFDTQVTTAEAFGRCQGGAAAGEGIEDEVAGVAGDADDPLQHRLR